MSNSLGTILFNGEDRVLLFKLFQADGVTPLDISSWTIAFNLGGTSNTPLITKACTVTSGPAGELSTAAITPSELNALTAGMYRFSLRRTNASNNTVLARGVVQVELTF